MEASTVSQGNCLGGGGSWVLCTPLVPMGSLSPAPTFSSQSLGVFCGEVSPWMELFPGVAMEIQQAHPLLRGLRDSGVLETDGDGLMWGSFSCKRMKGKVSSGAVLRLGELDLGAVVQGHP